jgi:hypothetical protein
MSRDRPFVPSDEELIQQAAPLIKATLGSLKPDETRVSLADGKVEYHFHGPVIINVGYNAETHLGDSALQEQGWGR